MLTAADRARMKAFGDVVSLSSAHDPFRVHFANYLIQMTPKYPYHVELEAGLFLFQKII